MSKCDECALKTLQNGSCPIFHADMSGKDGCPCYTAELHTCDVCGMVIVGHASILDIDETGNIHKICMQCANASQCQICVQKPKCAFIHDTSCKEPPQVIMQRQQGNMTIQTQIINPKRIEATCAAGCPCYWAEGLEDGNYCLKQLDCGCNKNKINWRN